MLQNFKKLDQKSKTFVYSIFILIIILLTNSYFDYNKSLILGGGDGISYFEIALKSPFLSETPLKPIHAERFFFPYMIGIISKILSIDIYLLFRITVIILLIFINYLLIHNFSITSKTKFTIIVMLLLVNLNPYLTRFYIANPLIINDLYFILGLLITISSINFKNRKGVFIGLIISTLARQSSIAILFGLFFIKFFKKNKFYLSTKDLILLTIIFASTYTISFVYSSMSVKDISHSKIYFLHFFGIFIEDISLKEFTIFLIWPFLSFGPLIMMWFFFAERKSNNELFSDLNIFIIISSFFLILQPIISGYSMSGKNIIRLTTLAYLPILIFYIKNFNYNLTNNIKTYIFYLIICLWTSHPTFSRFKFLEIIKF